MPKQVINYQSPYTVTSLLEYLAGTSLELALCWKLTAAATSPIAGTIVAATSDTRDLVLPGHSGVTFKSSRGGIPTVVDTEAGHQSAGLQVESVFDDSILTKESLEAGDWYRAKFEIFTVARKVLGMGQLIEFAGRLGKLDTEGQRFVAEARPLTSIAQAQVGQLVTAKSTTRLGDARCKISTALGQVAADGGAIRVMGTVTTSGGTLSFRDSSRTEALNYFGEVIFTSGALANRHFEVRAYDATLKEFTLRKSAHINIPVGTTYEAIRRCDQTVAMCRDVYNNILNYRGDPFITNVEEINRIDRAK